MRFDEVEPGVTVLLEQEELVVKCFVSSALEIQFNENRAMFIAEIEVSRIKNKYVLEAPAANADIEHSP